MPNRAYKAAGVTAKSIQIMHKSQYNWHWTANFCYFALKFLGDYFYHLRGRLLVPDRPLYPSQAQWPTQTVSKSCPTWMNERMILVYPTPTDFFAMYFVCPHIYFRVCTLIVKIMRKVFGWPENDGRKYIKFCTALAMASCTFAKSQPQKRLK